MNKNLIIAKQLLVIARQLAEDDEAEADWKSTLMKVAIPGLLNIMSPSPGAAQPAAPESSQQVKNTKLPKWVSNPMDGVENGRMGSVGQSRDGAAAISRESARTEAELRAQSNMLDQMIKLALNALEKTKSPEASKYKEKIENMSQLVEARVVEYYTVDEAGNKNNFKPYTVYVHMDMDLMQAIQTADAELKGSGMPDDLRTQVIKIMRESVK